MNTLTFKQKCRLLGQFRVKPDANYASSHGGITQTILCNPQEGTIVACTMRMLVSIPHVFENETEPFCCDAQGHSPAKVTITTYKETKPRQYKSQRETVMLGVPPKADVYKIFYPSWLGTPMEFRSATHSYPEDTTECYEYRTTQGLRLLRKSDVDAIKEVFNAFGADMKLYTQGGDDGNMVKFQGEGILVLLMPLSK